MNFIEDASSALVPHTKHLGQIIDKHGARIDQRLSELTQSSDLGRPDTADDFKFLVIRKKLAVGIYTFDNLVGGYDAGGPTLGEIWLIQSICFNGVPEKTPAFAVRTNTGRLIFAAKLEESNMQTPGGSVVLLQGEILELEILTEGFYDFTITVIQRKFPRQDPDAGFGTSMEQFEDNSRTAEHERDRDFPGEAYLPGEEDQVGVGGDISPDVM